MGRGNKQNNSRRNILLLVSSLFSVFVSWCTYCVYFKRSQRSSEDVYYSGSVSHLASGGGGSLHRSRHNDQHGRDLLSASSKLRLSSLRRVERFGAEGPGGEVLSFGCLVYPVGPCGVSPGFSGPRPMYANRFQRQNAKRCIDRGQIRVTDGSVSLGGCTWRGGGPKSFNFLERQQFGLVEPAAVARLIVGSAGDWKQLSGGN